MTADAARLPESFDELLQLVVHHPDARLASAAARAAMAMSSADQKPTRQQLPLPEELTHDQRRLAEALVREDIADVGGWMPGSKRLLRRWLGVDPPGVLERRVDWTHDGVAVRWPLWRVWRDAPEETLEFNQGIPLAFMELLTPAERIEAAAERTLERYGILGFALEARLRETLDRHAASAAEWASGFADLIAGIRSPDGPHARAEAIGYRMLGLYDWDTLAILTLLPLVRGGVALAERWDHLMPFTGDTALVREILSAVPPERREAVVYRRLRTDWGGDAGVRALNGFSTGLSLLDLAPSARVAEILAGKLRNNRAHFKKHIDKIRERLDAIAAEHPAVAEGLAPRRGKKKPARSE